MGAAEVATTCSADKAELVRRLGADVVVDYRTTQFEDVVRDYDVVLDTMSYLCVCDTNTTRLARRVCVFVCVCVRLGSQPSFFRSSASCR
jgi:NADPH:quinone reductase-like Zn-dependent oxidoreductase